MALKLLAGAASCAKPRGGIPPSAAALTPEIPKPFQKNLPLMVGAMRAPLIVR